MPLVLSKI